MVSSNSHQVMEKKRKRPSTDSFVEHESSRQDEEIQRLESKATLSPKYYNNIATVLSIIRDAGTNYRPDGGATLALCRIFTRLFVSGQFRNTKTHTQEEFLVQKWLEEKYSEFIAFLLEALDRRSLIDSNLAMTILMKLIQCEVCCQGHHMWATGLFSHVFRTIFKQPSQLDAAKGIFINEYFLKYDDVRLNSLQLLVEQLGDLEHSGNDICSNALQIMSALGEPPRELSDLQNRYLSHGRFFPSGEVPNTVKLARTHRKKGQEAWLSIIGLKLGKEQRKQLLRILVHEILPWIRGIERLMDFLTDSFNEGGETSLLALAGLFYLIQEKNLDYPLFYQKLYSLLDHGLLYSKHRSRFFRLLDTFMASTHLPAALVASFIKRLSRLALDAPPAGIVVVIPWIYNMFKRHPSCTFMIHREARSKEQKENWDQYGVEDTFDMTEEDPMETGAIDSCVWELETLQTHYHPNVATLARIISEQFTKQQYNLEDFLDYSYSSLFDAELSKDLKKTPVVEYQVSKYILENEYNGERILGHLLQKVFEES